MEGLRAQYDLTFSEKPGYLQVTVRADVWTPEMATDYNRKLGESVDIFDPECILLIRDIPITLRLAATVPLMSDFVDRLGRRKVAVVNPFQLLKQDLEFVMQVGNNRGGNYRLFDNVSDAERWLLL